MKNADAIKGLREWHGDELLHLDNYKDNRAIAPEYLDFRKKLKERRYKQVEYKQIIADDDQKY